MKKLIFFFSLSLFTLTSVLAEDCKKPNSLGEYVETANPRKPKPKEWIGVKNTLVSWGSIDVRYKKEEPAPECMHPIRKIVLRGWRGEKVAAQLVVSSADGVTGLRCLAGELKAGKHRIPQSAVFSGFVRYTLFDDLSIMCEKANHSEYDSTLVADPIDHITQSMDLEALSTRALWLRFDIPRTAASGKYSGTVRIFAGDKKLETLSVELVVVDRVLPDAAEWKFHLDMWQNPYAIARYHQLPLWSNEHFEVMKSYIKLYREAGGKSITASIMHKPWGGQTVQDPYQSLITWVKRVDGSWYYDYTLFDKWIEFMMAQGIRDNIQCYTMVPWEFSFQYFDQATQSLQCLKTRPGEAAYETLWTAMLSSFAKHLKEKGWFHITRIAMDERDKESMKRALEIIHKVEPAFKVSLAKEEFSSELNEHIHDYCVFLEPTRNEEFPQEALMWRHSQGYVSTIYTCCFPLRPSHALAANPAECEYLGIYPAAHNLNGYLYWALCSWNLDPLKDSRWRSFRGGDAYQIYPGPRTSIRFERFLYGVQQSEKIRILKEEYRAANNVKALQALEKTLSVLTSANALKDGCEHMVKYVKEQINVL